MWNYPLRFLFTLRHAFRNPIFLGYFLRLLWVSRIVPDLRGRVLDIGSGPQPFREWYGGVRQVVSLDLPATYEKFKGIPPDVFADGRALPFQSESFDGITSWEVIEHLPNPGCLFAEASRVLRPSGRLILSTPMASELHGEPYDFYRYTPHGIRYLAESHGLQVIQIHPTSGTLALIGQNFSVWIFTILGFGLRPLEFLLRPIFGIVQLLALVLDLLFGRRGHSLHNIAIIEKPPAETLGSKS